jgi:hypothetical protein
MRGEAAGTRLPGGGWAAGARAAASGVTAAGTCRWNCRPGPTAGAAGSAAADPASAAARRALGQLIMPGPGGRENAPVTVGQWLERWLAQRAGPRESTRRGYASHIRLYLAPYLGRVLLAELSASQVQAMFTAIARQRAAAGRPGVIGWCPDQSGRPAFGDSR